MSFVLRPDFPSHLFWRLGFAAALAVADSLALFGVEPQLKWPNDVFVHGKKIAGVLVEASPEFAIVGIGVNVNQTQFDGEFLTPPTSLRLELGEKIDVARVIDAVAGALKEHQSENWERILDGWRARLAVGATLRRGVEIGQFVGLNDDGSAQVRRTDTGTLTRWQTVEPEERAGEVS